MCRESKLSLVGVCGESRCNTISVSPDLIKATAKVPSQKHHQSPQALSFRVILAMHPEGGCMSKDKPSLVRTVCPEHLPKVAFPEQSALSTSPRWLNTQGQAFVFPSVICPLEQSWLNEQNKPRLFTLHGKSPTLNPKYRPQIATINSSLPGLLLGAETPMITPPGEKFSLQGGSRCAG